MCKCINTAPFPAIEIPDLTQSLDELDGLEFVVEDKLTATDAAVHVIDRSRKKKAGVSWHEISPMRGRDNPILLKHPQ